MDEYTHTVCIIEDEAPTRAYLQFMVEKLYPQLTIESLAGFQESVDFLRTHAPEIVLLDINLRGSNGFDLIPYVDTDRTKVIFVTADNQRALRAFEVNAENYLLKPVSQERFKAAMDKALDDVGTAAHQVVDQGLSQRLFVQRFDEGFFVNLRDVCSVQSDGYYTYLKDVEGRRFQYRKTLKEWISFLPASHFMQIHRSVVVNLNHVHRFVQNQAGGFDVMVTGEDNPLPMSRRHKKLFLERFENHFSESQ
ncbi:MAG: LytTR family DNA-binding domain-containing protein [Balneolaceae bacterium]|nr:LytTR family DNA-binding domain-containing protein [Balneolaceae bacterium]